METAKRVLIADDEKPIRSVLSKFLAKQNIQSDCASSGQEALQLLQEGEYDFLITDLMMPGMDGLELLQRVKTANRNIPVAIITGFGTLDLAIQALRFGAIDFIKKPFDFKSIARLLTKVFDRQKREASYQDAIALMTEASFVLPNDTSILESAGRIAAKQFEGKPEYDGVYLALIEALTNAMEHGNLEIHQTDKIEAMTSGSYYETERERLADPEFSDRRIYLRIETSNAAVTYKIRDEGKGFNWRELPDPTSPENLFSVGGRGVMLLRCYMDEVSWNESGNEITMVKKLKRPKNTASRPSRPSH